MPRFSAIPATHEAHTARRLAEKVPYCEDCPFAEEKPFGDTATLPRGEVVSLRDRAMLNGGHTHTLSVGHAGLLIALASRFGRPVQVWMLLKAVRFQAESDEGMVKTQVCLLRRRLPEIAPQLEVVTVRGVGYLLRYRAS